MSTIINATTTNGVVIQPDNSGSLVLQTNNGTTALTINTSQNVGIGTTSPVFASGGGLSIYNATAARIKLGDSTSGIGSLDGVELVYDEDAYLFNRENTALIFGTNNTERMRIDSSGRMTMPYQPAFQAYNASGQYITGITEAAFNSTYVNIGGHYNTSTGRFTAPIAGRYAFHFDGLFDNISSGHHISMRKNGGQLDGSEGYGDGLNICLSKSMVWNLAANDYISIFLDTASSRLHQRYGSFCGYLLG